ncbi:unnamed protein product [Cylindrotheca closterium]|uniref:Fungal lipase-type domain-containing protein n=1 Tax=Cylindrotheca closterium TaxID=2856 RepID=A0AAD2CGU2_9STRA|nr:unnamed protein product [Cylindrotheca closterium]
MMQLQISLICLLLLNKLQHGVALLTLTESSVERLAQAASLSYLAQGKMSTSPYSGTCDLELLYQFVDPVSESGATIFADQHNPSTLVVACRGSANPKSFGANLKFKLVPATRLSQNIIPDDAMVHEGFQDAAIGLWRQMGGTLLDLVVGESSSIKEIIFTGHSLGAATALLCAVHYNAAVMNNNSNKSPTPSIVTFGGPKLCNGSLARHLRNEALKGCNVLHLVHSKDPILANNKKLWDSMGFEDVGIELQCDPTVPIVYKETKPDKKGMFGNFAWNILDHCNYMGVFVGPRM